MDKLLNIVMIGLTILSCGIHSNGQVIKELNTNNSIDLARLMDKDSLFLQFCTGVDVDENGNLFFLDAKLGTVLHINKDSGKLIASISSKGQGPKELNWPTALRVRNSRIFVYDKGYGGVKIFNYKGYLQKEFKISNPGGGESIEVDGNNRIYVQSSNSEKLTIISIYDINGEKISDVIRAPSEKNDRQAYFINRYFKFRLDKDGNIVILFPLISKKIAKYSLDGRLLWEQIVSNKFIDEMENQEKLEFGKMNTVKMSKAIFDVDISNNNEIIIGHVGGGSVFNKDGIMTALIRFVPEDMNLYLFRVFDHSLVNILLFGGMVNVYRYE